MSEFFAMGGYAAFVWPAYGIVTLVLVGFLVTSLRALKENRRRLALLENRIREARSELTEVKAKDGQLRDTGA